MTLEQLLYRLESTKFLVFSESGDLIGYGDTSNSDYVHNINLNPNFNVLNFQPFYISSNYLKIVVEKR